MPPNLTQGKKAVKKKMHFFKLFLQQRKQENRAALE